MKNMILSIAKKEILDNIRNAWLLVVTIIYTALVLLVTYSGTVTQTIDTVGQLISTGLSPIVTTLVPIIGLMLGYTAIVGEIETGSLLLLGSHAVSRLDILLGKVIGRGFILVYSIILGFGFGGILVALNIPNADIGEYAIFIGATILLGFVFYCMGVMISTFFKRRTPAIGTSLAFWVVFAIFWPVIITILIFVVFSDITSNITPSLGDISYSIPSWLYAVDLFNPITEYSRLITLAIGSAADYNVIPMPDFYSAELMIGLLFFWTSIMLFISWIKFRYTDI
jgi:ABC-type transport system involved in multi-copper enzyme maturation permease subunit